MVERSSGKVSQSDVESALGIGGSRVGEVRRTGRRLAYALAGGAGAFAIWWAVAYGDSTGPVEFVTDPAARGDVTAVVTATGTIEPTKQVDVSSELSGIVRSVAVDYNSRVAAGQTLAELDTDKLEAAVAASRAKLAAARARVAEASATLAEKGHDYARKKKLAESQIVSSQELQTAHAAYERAEAALLSSRADVDAAEADLKLNETNLAKARITSPIDGVVLGRNVDPGQTVASSLQAPVLFTIAEDLSQMEVRVDVDEADVGKVRDGQSATFTVDAYPERQFTATIRELRFGSEIVQGVVTYKAVLTTDNSALLLRPGMTATAEIIVQEARDVLTVSNEALRFTPEAEAPTDNRSFLQRLIPSMPQFRPPSRPTLTGSERELWINKDDAAIAVAVTIGITDGRRTEIVSGSIEAGDEVIIDAGTPDT